MTPQTRLETPRLVLRQPVATDLPAYTAYCASPRSTFVRGPFTEAEAFDKFAAMIGHWSLRGFGRYVIEWQGRPIGHAGPLAPMADHIPELTWTLWDGACEGQGLATEAAACVRDHLLNDCGWPELTVLVMPDNVASVRVAEKLGAARQDVPSPDWYAGCLTYSLRPEVFA